MADDRFSGRLEEIRVRFEEVERRLSDPAVASDPTQLRALGKEHSELLPIVRRHRDLARAAEDISAARDMVSDADEADSAFLRAEIEELEARRDRLEAELRTLLVPKDPFDEKDVIVEIRAAAGGDEAALWARDLFEMYQRYAERNRLKLEPLSASALGTGGFKEVIFSARGKGAYSFLKYESGVHRVQRVPATESAGRIHTSTATVAVLPEAEAVDVEIKDSDLKIDVYRSSGPGGQSVNTTDSAVRITHLPTGEVVACQEERSQLQNRERAMRILRARLLQRAQEAQRAQIAAQRKGQVGTGERSEKIRTYNFKENRVTDHRVGVTLYKLDRVLDGELDELVDAMRIAEHNQRLGPDAAAS